MSLNGGRKRCGFRNRDLERGQAFSGSVRVLFRRRAPHAFSPRDSVADRKDNSAIREWRGDVHKHRSRVFNRGGLGQPANRLIELFGQCPGRFRGCRFDGSSHGSIDSRRDALLNLVLDCGGNTRLHLAVQRSVQPVRHFALDRCGQACSHFGIDGGRHSGFHFAFDGVAEARLYFGVNRPFDPGGNLSVDGRSNPRGHFTFNGGSEARFHLGFDLLFQILAEARKGLLTNFPPGGGGRGRRHFTLLSYILTERYGSGGSGRTPMPAPSVSPGTAGKIERWTYHCRMKDICQTKVPLSRAERGELDAPSLSGCFKRELQWHFAAGRPRAWRAPPRKW